MEIYDDIESIEEAMDMILYEDIIGNDLGLETNFAQLQIGGHKYINSKQTFKLLYKGRSCMVTVYYRPEFGRFNKYQLKKAIEQGACNIAQSNIDKLPTPPNLVIWDSKGMRAVFNDGTKVTDYFIYKE